MSGDRKFRPAQVLALVFMAAILIGAALFHLPFSTQSGRISFIDALFRSTSAVCVTGLIVNDTAATFTTAGQVINLILFQLGGLGILTFSTLILLVAGKSISIQDRIIIQQGFHHGAPRNFKNLIVNIFAFALGIEAIGTLLLFFRWSGEFDVGRAIYVSVFHSVSAFCNAGFSVFSDSLMSYRADVWINVVMMVLIVLGGLGFLVFQDVGDRVSCLVRKKKCRMPLHSKLVLVTTVFLIVLSLALFLGIEGGGGLRDMGVKDKVLAAAFQVITARTAGFNTIDLNTLSRATVFLMLSLMFIGASPGSTGGGIKTSTLGVIFAFLKSKITARDTVHLFFRTLPGELVSKAFVVGMLGFSIVCLSSFALFLVQPEISMKEGLFESISAFGTVGLSLGITPRLNTAAKTVIILTMYIGRIGPLTLLYAFSRRKSFGRYKFVEENVMIG